MHIATSGKVTLSFVRSATVIVIVALTLLIKPMPVAAMEPTEIYKEAKSGIVLIEAFSSDESQISQGSGFLIDEIGTVVTNYHVIDGACLLRVTLEDKSTTNVKTLSFDPMQDFAVLRTDGLEGTPLRLGSVRDLEPGSKVLAMGFPRADITQNKISITDGTFSALTELRPGQPMLQISAPISPGSSGGPLLNSEGEVVGITTSSAAAPGTQNLNFAVSIDLIRALNLETEPQDLSALCAAGSILPPLSPAHDPDDGREALERFKVMAERIFQATRKLGGPKTCRNAAPRSSWKSTRDYKYELSWFDPPENFYFNVYQVQPELSVVTTYMGYVEIPITSQRQKVSLLASERDACSGLFYRECVAAGATVKKQGPVNKYPTKHVWGLAYQEGVWKIKRVFGAGSAVSFMRNVDQVKVELIYRDIFGSADR